MRSPSESGKSATLVVAAWEPELEVLAGRLAGARFAAIGVGLIEAAAGAERAIAAHRPARVILVGTAGALPGGPAVGGLVVARAARLCLRPGEYAPAPMPLQAAGDLGLARALAGPIGASLVEVVSPIGITSDDAEAARLGASAAVEHLECFALLRAAERAQVPATALFAIANRVGASAADEWRRNRVAAEAAAQEALVRAWELFAGPAVR